MSRGYILESSQAPNFFVSTEDSAFSMFGMKGLTRASLRVGGEPQTDKRYLYFVSLRYISFFVLVFFASRGHCCVPCTSFRGFCVPLSLVAPPRLGSSAFSHLSVISDLRRRYGGMVNEFVGALEVKYVVRSSRAEEERELCCTPTPDSSAWSCRKETATACVVVHTYIRL